MVDAPTVSIESALIDRLNALVLVPALLVAQPNVKFTPPIAGPNVGWLRGTFLPADSFELAVAHDGLNQHYGIFQVDVLYGMGSGELAPGRVVASVLSWFQRGTRLVKNGIIVDIKRLPFRGRMINDDPWVMIPISIPYLSFTN